MDKPLQHHIAEVKHKISLYEHARDSETDDRIRAQWAIAIRQMQLALAHYELALQIETTTSVPLGKTV